MDEFLYLPPGFRFHPTDEEIITHYLSNKIIDRNFSPVAIAEANFNDCEPWDLPSKAKMGEKEWFFFCQKDRKYPTGMRTNRATESGYWKATGKDKEIYKGKGVLVGMKKTLVFYIGRAPRGQKSNWVMHEYRLEGKHNQHFNLYKYRQDEWVVYKVYNKIKDSKMVPTQDLATNMNSFVDDFLVETPSLPYLMDSSFFNSSNKEMEEPDIKEEIMRAPLLIPDQSFFALSGSVKIEQSSNSMASAEECSAFSDHQIGSLEMQDYADDPSSSGLQAMDFDCLLNYAFV